MDIDSFELDDSQEEKLQESLDNFIDEQEEVEVINECEGGACAI